jgi:hypothetical protein
MRNMIVMYNLLMQ